MTHSRDVWQVFLEAKSHELLSFKKAKERSTIDRVSDSVSLFVSKVMIKNPDERFVAMSAYVTAFDTFAKDLNKAVTSVGNHDLELVTCVPGVANRLFSPH
jgi:hypothetical protein